MTKKRLLLIALPVAVAVTLGVLAMLPPQPGVTKANFDGIEKGMTLTEVQRIFGQDGEGPWFPTEFKNRTYWYWYDGDWPGASILFLDNCVFEKEWRDSHETIFRKIRRWLHLP